MTSEQYNALYKLYPQIVKTVGDIAYDAEGNEVFYDLTNVNAQALVNEQESVAAKESALSKLTALGLTADEVKALLGVA